MSLVKRATWVIERNLDRELSLGDIAEACSVSTYHLSHAFTERAGMPVTDYVRGRRLSHAAEKLVAGWPDILDLALASGYGSHEAFTRAFKARFGLSPDALRKRGHLQDLPFLDALDMMTTGESALEQPILREMKDQTLACLSERFSMTEMQGIPDLWRRFFGYYPYIDKLAGSGPVGMMGVVADDACFDYACAALIDPKGDVPKELSKVRITAHRYAVYKHHEHVSTIRGTYARIWDAGLVASGWTMANRPSFEVHEPQFDPLTGEGGVAIWVPVLALGSEQRP